MRALLYKTAILLVRCSQCKVMHILFWSYLLLAHGRRSVPGSADTSSDSILSNEDNLFSISDLPSENRNVFASLGELTATIIIIVTNVNPVKLSRTHQYVSATQDQIPCTFRHLWWPKSLNFVSWKLLKYAKDMSLVVIEQSWLYILNKLWSLNIESKLL